MTVASIQIDRMGANPFAIEGPVVLGSGVIAPQFKLGEVTDGDAGAEWIYCKLVLASITTLGVGDVYTWDKSFTATLLSTSNSPRGQQVGVGCVALASAPVGTYFIWLQRSGQALVNVVATTPLANTLMETTATAGTVGAPTTPTVTSKLILGAVLTAANAGAATTIEAILSWPTIDKTN